MSVSETNTPASTATSVTATEEKNAPTLAEVVRKYNKDELIEFLRREKDLELDEDDLEIIKKRKIAGRDFLKKTEEKFMKDGLESGPATRLADFAKELGKRKLKSFSSYKTLKDLSEVLEKYGIVSGDITRIPQFIPRK
jgi:hypothetical protein